MAAAHIGKLLSLADRYELARSTCRGDRCSDTMRIEQSARREKEAKTS
jgi:hypothetical protein